MPNIESPAIATKELLYNRWLLPTPAKDTVMETFLPTAVHFTTRLKATNPERIHNYQITVRRGRLKKSPEEVGSIVMYKCEEDLLIHLWAIAGIGDDFETIEQDMANMMTQVDSILRIAAIAADGIQFIRISPGATPNDQLQSTRILHKVVDATAIYYETDTTVPSTVGFTIKYDGGDTYDSARRIYG